MALKAHLDPVATSVGQRRQPRRSLKLETSGALPGGLAANVTIHNISAAGLLMETELPLSQGDQFVIDLPEAGPANVEIVWASGTLFGCAFERALGQAALAASQLRSIATRVPTSKAGRSTSEPLGIKLNRLRRERSMTLAQIAGALGVSKPTVWAWEKGKARPVPERMPDIASALGVTVEELGEAAPAGESAALVEECRIRIASAYGADVDRVKIMIEV